MHVNVADESGNLSFAEAMQRVRAEFVEMPGLRVTPAQGARLWHFEKDFCEAVLSALVEARFLVRTRNSLFARA
ncbi:MAG TPA: hypothetical protein VIX63_16025 [Vicinamibacterales bacterium]